MHTEDGWEHLRAFTAARIALGRAGGSLPSTPWLSFQLAHARARDAVWSAFDLKAMRKQLEPLGLSVLSLRSQATDRADYLRRPDLGRKLQETADEALSQCAAPSDVCFVVTDGLSSYAVAENAFPFLETLLPLLIQEGLRVGPLCLVTQGRVAIGDEIAVQLGSRLVVVLIGERPGLSAPNSMGIYFTYQPHPGITDEKRNCISNVRPEGLPPTAAAEKLHYLLREAFRRKLTGLALKDDQELRLR
ncbi:ethanolamine ammonia-lyase small subunit [Catalinimonas alkaloidigena]|uniref:Ethanolamine ammonia-lyase small subunit n=1 Tax=Catalinimonas alkaloidigena TaxID=1075417 RepID=A0A1G9AMY9_9BACT|nr:ethanolamine ammonia-lyase subunit EutC [Catalinimonas alkaloidigena]SDK28692.1 ethanolamine ammonia-lyase small subunit [Catalinimonas alkaloidigena]